MRGRWRRGHCAMAAVTARPRVFVAQPIAASALDRLRAIAAVKINPDSSKIISKSRMIAGVRNCDILISLLHDKVDRAVLAANPKLRAVCSMAITPDNIDVAAAVAKEEISISEAERAEIGVTHAEVGGYLLGLWGIPPPIVNIVSHHHHPLMPMDPGISAMLAVHAADVLAGRAEKPPLFEHAKLDGPVFIQAGLAARIPIWEELA